MIEGLEVSFIIDSLHFHWGQDDENGSEHKLFGRNTAAEAHIVAYNSKYDSIMVAKDEPDGLAVVGILYYVRKFKFHRQILLTAVLFLV